MTGIRLSIEPTEEFFMAGDVMVRAWRGTDENGAQVIALVTAVAIANDARDIPGLVTIPPPDGEAARRWAAEVLSKRYDD